MAELDAENVRVEHEGLPPSYRMTASMKNLFGVVPGAVYGWPKNLLHVRGIEQSIIDLTATVRPQLTIVDAVVGMLAALLPGGPVVRYPPFYGPQVSVFFAPFARLQYPSALTLWMAISLAVYLVCAFFVWRACCRRCAAA